MSSGHGSFSMMSSGIYWRGVWVVRCKRLWQHRDDCWSCHLWLMQPEVALTLCHLKGVLVSLWIMFQEPPRPPNLPPVRAPRPRVWKPAISLRVWFLKACAERWSYAPFECNSLLCNQTPSFHNRSTLTVAHQFSCSPQEKLQLNQTQYNFITPNI